jgi:hypothetical protein
LVTDEGRLFRRVELHASPEQKEAVYRSILDSSHIDVKYAALLTVAGLIALFGRAACPEVAFRTWATA